MMLRTKGLRHRILQAVNAQWGVLKQDHRVLRSQYNLSQVQLDRYLKDYNTPTNQEIGAWEDKVSYYRRMPLDERKVMEKDFQESVYSGFELDNGFVNIREVRKGSSNNWFQKLGAKGTNEWVIRQLSKGKSIGIKSKCDDLLKDLCCDMNQFKCGFRYNKEELNEIQLDECRATIIYCEIINQYPINIEDWNKLELVDSLLNNNNNNNLNEKSSSLLSAIEGNTSIDHLLKLAKILKLENDPVSAMEYLKLNPVNIKMMNLMVKLNPSKVLKIMHKRGIEPNFETFIQLLKVSNYQETINLFQYILKNKIVCKPLWIEMLKAGIRTKNVKVVEAMFFFNQRQEFNSLEVESIADYEIFDQLAIRYQFKGIDFIKLDDEICSKVYEMYNEMKDGEGMMKIVNEWERIKR